jgi:hypothetical protein
MATTKLLGADDITGTNLGADYFRLARFQALATGKVTEFRIKAGGSAQVKVAIYADNGGEPGALLSYNNTAQDVVSGWNTLSIPELNVEEGAYYWLATNMTASGGIYTTGGTGRWKSGQTFSTFNFPDPAGSGFTTTTSLYVWASWGVLVISPTGLSQPISYGTPKLSLSVKIPSHQQPVSYGEPTVGISGIVISPQGIAVIVLYGMPALRCPQTISPSGLAVPIAYGMPTLIFSGAAVIYIPGHQQVIACGTPIILKYVWHVILDGQYNIESPEVNRAYIIGRDINGTPVYGEAHDSDESGLVGERLDFQPDPAIPTTAQAADVASAVLAKRRLTGKRGVILIPPNCGQELWDVVQITDAGANQQAVKFRVVGIRFEYNPRQARYEHKLILGAP